MTFQTWLYPDIIRCLTCHALFGVEQGDAVLDCPICRGFEIVRRLRELSDVLITCPWCSSVLPQHLDDCEFSAAVEGVGQ